jgi:DUF971 family protein
MSEHVNERAIDTGNYPWPTEIRLAKARDTLHVTFDNGESYALTAEYLRVASPSAEVRGHGAGSARLVIGKENVKIETLEPVGNYAIRIIFDDGHSTGLYSWDYLFDLGSQKTRIWAEYLDAREKILKKT